MEGLYFSPFVEHVIITCKHYVLSKEWYPEESGQYCQGGSHTREHLREATALCGEAGEGSSTHDAMWVAA